jgi:hypothetical protein
MKPSWNEFDFDRVHKVMMHLNWTYSDDKDVPTVEYLRQARGYLIRVQKPWKERLNILLVVFDMKRKSTMEMPKEPMDTCGFAWHLKLRDGITQNDKSHTRSFNRGSHCVWSTATHHSWYWNSFWSIIEMIRLSCGHEVNDFNIHIR